MPSNRFSPRKLIQAIRSCRKVLPRAKSRSTTTSPRLCSASKFTATPRPASPSRRRRQTSIFNTLLKNSVFQPSTLNYHEQTLRNVLSIVYWDPRTTITPPPLHLTASFQLKLKMAAQSKIVVPQTTCTKRDCPLNEAGIQHSEGIYKHEGKDVGFNLVFAMSNPPQFMQDASVSFWKAVRAKHTAKGDELKEIEKVIKKDGGNLHRFLNYHAGCKCKKHDCKGDTH